MVRAVWIHRPEVMELDVAAINVFPAGIEDATVGQDPGSVVLPRVEGEAADVAAVDFAAVDGAHLRHPAGHPTAAAGGDEGDAAIGQVGRLIIVVRPVGNLPEAAAVKLDLVEVVVMRACLEVGEDGLVAVIMDLRIADGAPFGVKEDGGLARGEMELHEPAVGVTAIAGEGQPRCVAAVVANVGVPMGVFAEVDHLRLFAEKGDGRGSIEARAAIGTADGEEHVLNTGDCLLPTLAANRFGCGVKADSPSEDNQHNLQYFHQHGPLMRVPPNACDEPLPEA